MFRPKKSSPRTKMEGVKPRKRVKRVAVEKTSFALFNKAKLVFSTAIIN